jgi:HD domain
MAATPAPVAKARRLEASPRRLERRVAIFVTAIAILAAAALLTAIPASPLPGSGESPRIAALLVLTLVLQMFSVRVYGRGSVGVAAIGVLASVFLLDTSAAMLIAIAAATAQWVRRRGQLYKAVFDASNFALAAAASSLCFHALEQWPLVAASLAGVVYASVNNTLLCVAMSLGEHLPWRAVWSERFHWGRFHFALFGPVALAAATAYEHIGTAGLAAFALPPGLMALSVSQYLNRTAAAVEEIRQAHLSLRRAHRNTIAALSRSMAAKDLYTGGHTERVAVVAVNLARRLGFTAEELEAIEIGALLHDIGKIGIPGQILRKRRPLDRAEWELIKTHPIISDEILAELDLHPLVRQCARSSHERIDGNGYPDRLAGEEIPLAARIVFVADALDALTSTRPYRAARLVPAALGEIRTHTGSQFCPRVVAALEDLWRDEPAILSPELAERPAVA